MDAITIAKRLDIHDDDEIKYDYKRCVFYSELSRKDALFPLLADKIKIKDKDGEEWAYLREGKDLYDELNSFFRSSTA